MIGRTCAEPGCEKPVRQSQTDRLCGMHRMRLRRATLPRSYVTWLDMRARCLSPAHKAYHRYGGRGITIDPRWGSFASFLADMGDHPKGWTLHRVDNDGPYTKSNCTWMSRADHNRLHGAQDRKGVPRQVWAPGTKRRKAVAA